MIFLVINVHDFFSHKCPSMSHKFFHKFLALAQTPKGVIYEIQKQ